MAKTKKTLPFQTAGKIDEQQKKSKQKEEQQSLIAGANALLGQDFSDAALDKQLEKNFLLDYARRHPRNIYIAAALQPYEPKFPMEYYRHIYRLNNWPTDADKLYHRPGIVGTWTNDLIYDRFPNGILKVLQELNPMIEPGVRLHKHFQLLTLLGEVQLKGFIEDAIRIMGKASYWHQFRRMYAKEFGAIYQPDLFDSE
jgi:hypothetical protein